MNSIIRSNAIETSSQTENSGMNFHNLYPYCDLVSEKAFIYKGDVASTKAALPEASTDTHTATVTNPQIASKTTGYWSTSLQTLEQLPLTLAHLVTPRSIAFFTVVVVWAWTGKIEQVSHVRGKFVALSEPEKLQLQHLGKVVNPAVEETQLKTDTNQVVAELDIELLGSEVEEQKQDLAADQMQFKHIKDLMAQTRMLAQRSASVRAQEKQAGLGASDKQRTTTEMPVQPPERLKPRQIQQSAKGMTHMQTKKVQKNLDASVKQDFSTSSKTTESIFPTAKPLKKLGQIHRVKVALAGETITNQRKIIKLKADQTATAK